LKLPRALGVTGTPCTGKKSVSPRLASILGMTLVDVNGVAKSLAPKSGSDLPGGELAVDTDALRAELLKHRVRDSIVFGHLLPDVLRKKELGFVAVLRCEPLILKRRLEARGYDHAKVVENVEAELIGVVLDAALRAFGKSRVHEYDTTRSSPKAVAEKIAADFRAGVPQDRPWMDWTLRYDSPTKLRLLFLSATERTGPPST
jgi:adenylate kinase